MIARRGLLAAPLALALAARLSAAETRVEWADPKSPLMPPMRVSIALPPGYAGSDARYPVLYMHDGQNLFDPATAMGNIPWAVDTTAARLAAAGSIPPLIIVGIHSGKDRTRTYLPAGIVGALPRFVMAGLQRRLNGPVQSQAYLRWIAESLKPRVDAAFRTRPERASTGLMGSSMGGLISLAGLMDHPQVFGFAGCLSTHWPLFIEQPPPYAADVQAAWTKLLTDDLDSPRGRRLWFDHGTETLDAGYAPYQAVIDTLLPTLGWVKGRDFESRAYPGAAHTEAAWAARVQDPLRWLLRA
ncbi:alpha/beta hydrolase [Sandaracinobacteroides saxicola]|uniref:Alpha/beta hydrolase n=1 Tax=Sandaracinobacteroides saxicola TaxID=2759707 RepID=A0A7G5IFL7_9SPHN|nr:alpha/beta hydrolase-fold protein [Sandaracinobacteroides saxicola]QMW22159.1 alpha/beta hydrolase [Sandaracinobacteroides saxicola]